MENIEQFTPHFSEVPIDIYRFFGIDIGTADGRTIDRLKKISEWTFGDTETLGSGMDKLRKLEIKMGTPKAGQSRDIRILSHIKLQNQIDDMIKRQEAI